jgi:hypothetical protein
MTPENSFVIRKHSKIVAFVNYNPCTPDGSGKRAPYAVSLGLYILTF